MEGVFVLIVLLFQCTLAMGEHIKTTRLIVHKIGYDEACGEGSLEDFAREKAPVARQGKIGVFQSTEIGRNLCKRELPLEWRKMLGRTGPIT